MQIFFKGTKKYDSQTYILQTAAKHFLMCGLAVMLSASMECIHMVKDVLLEEDCHLSSECSPLGFRRQYRASQRPVLYKSQKTEIKLGCDHFSFSMVIFQARVPFTL